jgi:hypothetical protein
MRRPSFQFYPGVWQSNGNLRRCTHEEKGIWIDVMCVFHDAPEYGAIRWPLKELAQAAGVSTAKLRGLISKGVLKGADAGQRCEAFIFTPTAAGRTKGDPVTLIEEQAGPIWFSSRMVEDEYKRVIRGEYGNAPKGAPDHAPMPPIGAAPKTPLDLAPNPPPDYAPSRAGASSSSSSSSKPSCAIASHGDFGKGDPEGFSDCWNAYPKRSGGNSRKEAEKAYRARLKAGASPADMLAGVRRYAAYIRATEREGTAYVKQASTFFGTGEHWREAWELPGASAASPDWRNDPAFRGCA